MDTQSTFCEEEMKKTSPNKRRVVFFMQGFIFSALVFWSLNSAQNGLESYLYADISRPIANLALASSARSSEAPLEIKAKAALVKKIGANGREKFIYKLDGDDPIPLASLTKLMTATIVLENKDRYDYDELVLVSSAAASQDDVPVFGNLTAKDEYTIKELLELMLQYSSNDAAFQLSEVIGTSNFVDKMNNKAAELGLDSTVFFNPSGLDLSNGDTNMSSPKDMVDLTEYILENHSEILEMTARMPAYLTVNGIHSLEFWDGQVLVGGKTGYTAKAGGCMIVVSRNSQNTTYINAVFGADSAESRVREMQKLINLSNN
ncbi:MAG TPA: serine hydrolase [Candidatus Paceibacterota bacterium]|nr:serine hydrolase [Candidatus Pacearchaeota archaeon]HRZ51266.1 serine hydrolase [Candidatus Paceibacterota bacterium]HSA36988.1 serine hydrolase [Candidatus Paceibacterota bacterium]